MSKFVWRILLPLVIFTLSFATVFAQEASPVTIDGSLSMEAVVTALANTYGGEVEIATNGPNNAFAALCNGELDVVMSTRFMNDAEAAACDTNDIEFIETIVGYEALVAVVPPTLETACIGLTELDAVYGLASDGTEGDIQQLDPTLPESAPLMIYSAAAGSPAAELLVSILPSGEARTDLTTYETPAEAVELVNGDTAGIAYMTYSDYTALEDQSAVMVLGTRDDTGNCITPSPGTIETGSYTMQRPLLLYTTTASLPKTNALLEFVSGEEGAAAISEQFAFTPASEAGYDRNKNNLLLPLTGRTFSRPVTPTGITTAAAGEVNVNGSPLAGEVAKTLTSSLTSQYTGVTLNLNLLGDGWDALCGGTADAIFADTPATEAQLQACADADIDVFSTDLATEAIVFAVAAKNEDLPACVSPEILANAFAAPIPESDEIPLAEDREIPTGITNWNELDSSYPDAPLFVILPGRSSVEADWVFSAAGLTGRFSRSDSEANVLYNRAGGDQGLFRAASTANYDGAALTVLDWQDYQASEHKGDLRLLEIETDAGCVAPSEETFADGTYPFAKSFSLHLASARMEDEAVAAFLWTVLNEDALTALENLDLASTNVSDLRRQQDTVFALIEEARQRVADRVAAEAEAEAVIDSVLQDGTPQAPEATEAATEAATEEAMTPEATEEATLEATEEATPSQ